MGMAVFVSDVKNSIATIRTRTAHSILASLLCLSIVAIVGCSHANEPTNSPPMDLRLNPNTAVANLQLEWADTAKARQMGLMRRTTLENNEVMMFVFDDATQVHCFWMKDTPIPLSVGFISPQGQLVQIAHMQPNSTDIHCPAQAIAYALEVNQGWFEHHQVGIGTQVFSAR